jgi:hypothetical protein
MCPCDPPLAIRLAIRNAIRLNQTNQTPIQTLPPPLWKRGGQSDCRPHSLIATAP